MRSIERFVSRAISAPHQGQASSARSSRRISEGSPIGSVEAALQRVKMRLGAELRAIFPMARRQFPSAPDAPRALNVDHPLLRPFRSEEHTSELQSLMRISYAVFCLKKTNSPTQHNHTHN